MGTHLRLKPERQRAMGKDNNIAWRPDNKMFAVGFANADSPTRQLQLDPDMTEVDTYDPVHNPTGDPKETADMRHDNVSLPKFKLNVGIETPLICDDPPTAGTPGRSASHRARFVRHRPGHGNPGKASWSGSTPTRSCACPRETGQHRPRPSSLPTWCCGTCCG
ncbi:hypothetical protein ABXT21_20240 [Ralstonia sp. SM1864_UCD524_TZ4]|nr:hypothetical protein [Ralstonia pseudosolanacearum]CUV40553.1 protein of unknown function [Ralstonia solanacearum]